MMPGVPGPGDSASIPGGIHATLSRAVTVASLTALDTATIDGQNLIVTASCALTGVDLAGPGTLTLEGTTTITPGQISTATRIKGGRNVTNGGTLTLKDGAQLVFNTKATLTNNGTFQVEDNTTVMIGNEGEGSEVDNSSILSKATGAGSASISGVRLKNLPAGTVNCASGILLIDGGSDQSGSFQTALGAQIKIGGEIDMHDGASFDGTGTTSLVGGPGYLDGTARVNGHFVMDTLAPTFYPLNLYANGDPTNTGIFFVEAGGTLDWVSGNFVGTDAGFAIGINSDGKMNIDGDGTELDNLLLQNDGTITWVAGSIVLSKAAIFNAGTFDIQTDDRLTDLGSDSLFNNTGLVKKSFSPNDPSSETPGLTEIQVGFSNAPASILQCSAGSLQLENGSTQLSGTIGAGEGNILNLESRNGSHYTITDTLDVVGLGRTSVNSTGTNPVLIFEDSNKGGAITVNGGTLELANGNQFTAGSVSGVGSITVLAGSTLAWSGGNIDDGSQGQAGTGSVFIKDGATLLISGSGRALNGWRLNNNGAATVLPGTGDISFGPGSSVNNGGTFDFQSDNSFLDKSSGKLSPNFFNFNTGVISKTAGAGTTQVFNLFSDGTVTIKSGTLSVIGTYTDKTGTTPPGVINLDLGTIEFDQPETLHGTISGSGTIKAKGGLTNDGIVEGDDVELVGDLTNDGGTIRVGDAPGVITIQGNFTQTAGGSMYVPIQGTDASIPDFGQLKVSGNVTLGGSLFFTLENNFVPASGDTFPFLSAGSTTGQFTTTRGGQISLSATGAAASNVSGLPDNSFRNISTRLRVGTGSDVLIGGFIVQGPGTKRLLIRGIGPSLATAGISAVLADPSLDLHDSTGATIATNDNWKDTQQTDIEATGIPPIEDDESAILTTVFPGAYTAVLSGVKGTTGVGLVEVYDLDGGVVQPVNISTRGFVETGDNVMIGGFIIGGTQPMMTLVRAIGPSLSSAGITDALGDPALELHNASGDLLFANDNWKDAQQAAIEATGIPPNDDSESAILMTLQPGAYTAVVSGNGGTGVCLVEVYNLR
jgi:hypothetical protein